MVRILSIEEIIKAMMIDVVVTMIEDMTNLILQGITDAMMITTGTVIIIDVMIDIVAGMKSID